MHQAPVLNTINNNTKAYLPGHVYANASWVADAAHTQGTGREGNKR
jgi:hypothetical protein